jgi:hypothetical protein
METSPFFRRQSPNLLRWLAIHPVPVPTAHSSRKRRGQPQANTDTGEVVLVPDGFRGCRLRVEAEPVVGADACDAAHPTPR